MKCFTWMEEAAPRGPSPEPNCFGIAETTRAAFTAAAHGGMVASGSSRPLRQQDSRNSVCSASGSLASWSCIAGNLEVHTVLSGVAGLLGNIHLNRAERCCHTGLSETPGPC